MERDGKVEREGGERAEVRWIEFLVAEHAWIRRFVCSERGLKVVGGRIRVLIRVELDEEAN